MDKNYNVFDTSADIDVNITASTKRYREAKRNLPMLEHLFSKDTVTDDLTVLVLKTHATAMIQRLQKDKGGAVEFLPGGKYHVITPELRKSMEKVAATSDCIESLFGVLDMIVSSHSKNLSFHVVSALATYVYNKTGDWVDGLTYQQQKLLYVNARRHGRKQKKESDECKDSADRELGNRMDRDAVKNETKDESKVLMILDLTEQELFRTSVQWKQFVVTVTNEIKTKHTNTTTTQINKKIQSKLIKEIRLQIRILSKVHTHTHTHSHSVIIIHHSLLMCDRYMGFLV